MEDKREPLTPEIRRLIDAYKSKQVLPDLEIAEASYTVLDGYRWLPSPTMPEKVVEFNKLAVETKKKMFANPEQYDGYFRHPTVMNYFDTKERIENKNLVNKQWLAWMKTVITDEGKLAGINLMLHRFSDAYVDFIEQPKWTE